MCVHFLAEVKQQLLTFVRSIDCTSEVVSDLPGFPSGCEEVVLKRKFLVRGFIWRRKKWVSVQNEAIALEHLHHSTALYPKQITGIWA